MQPDALSASEFFSVAVIRATRALFAENKTYRVCFPFCTAVSLFPGAHSAAELWVCIARSPSALSSVPQQCLIGRDLTGALIPPIVNKLTTNGTAIVFVLSKLSQNVQNVKETVYSSKDLNSFSELPVLVCSARCIAGWKGSGSAFQHWLFVVGLSAACWLL